MKFDVIKHGRPQIRCPDCNDANYKQMLQEGRDGAPPWPRYECLSCGCLYRVAEEKRLTPAEEPDTEPEPGGVNE